MLHRFTTQPAATKTYDSDDDQGFSSSISGWRPYTLSRPILALFNLTTVVFIGILASLLWRNITLGGILFAANGDRFDDFQTFLFRYLPVVITVGYSLCWSWVDLDIKRLEPYYQLANSGMTSSRQSLSLQYPSIFFALVPYFSAKAGHWLVFAVSTVSIMTNWVTIPLQNAIFITKPLAIEKTLQASQPYQLPLSAAQGDRMSSGFIRDTSSILWLGQQLPPFTTKEFALAPVDFSDTATDRNHTLRVNTTLYELDFTCSPPANINISQNHYAFDDGRGCNTQELIPVNSSSTVPKFEAYHVGHTHGAFADPRFTFSLSDTVCPGNDKIFLAWRRTTSSQSNFDDVNNATALFCSTSFHYQSVEAVLQGPGRTVSSYQRKGERKVLDATRFNQTSFRFITAWGGSPMLEKSGFMESEKLGQDSFIANMSIMVPTDTMVGLAIGSTHFPPDAYLNATTLAQAYQSAYRLAFALSIHYLLEPPNDSTSATVSLATIFEVVSIVPVFVIMMQTMLVITTCFSVFLFFAAPKRTSKLHRDPDCISENLLLAHDSAVRKAASDMQPHVNCNLEAHRNITFSLQSNGPARYPAINIHRSVLPTDTESRHPSRIPVISTTLSQPRNRDVVEPIEYRWYTGGVLCLLITSMLALLYILNFQSKAQNGLPLPNVDEIIIQIVTNILPTLLAAILEPIWIWLTRMACILAPIENLQKKNEPANRSLMLKYAAVPPQIVAWQALKSRNFVLSLLSLTALTAGALTITVSGMFIISPTTVVVSTPLPSLFSGQLQDKVGFLDVVDGAREYWVALPNITKHTSLPTWTSPHQFFLPVNFDSLVDQAQITEISLRAPGYSIDPQCVPLTTAAAAKNTYDLSMVNNATRMNFTTSHRMENGSVFRCAPHFNDVVPSNHSYGSSLARISGDRSGPRLARIGHTMSPLGQVFINSANVSDSIADPGSSGCGEMMIFGSIRLSAASISNTTKLNSGNRTDFSSSFMVCKPKVVMQMFNITTSTAGLVLSAKPLSEPSDVLGPDINYTSIVQDLIRTLGRFSVELEWSNSSSPLLFVDQLQMLLTNSTLFLDPKPPLTPIGTQIPLVEDVFQRIFAISLRLSLRRFIPATGTTAPVLVQVKKIERRIFVSPLPFKISVTILSLQLFVAILFFSTRPRPFLKRLPTNLAAQISLFANSHVVDDVISTAQGDFKELDRQGWKYGYGKFIGVDGKPGEGIERDIFLTKLGARPTGFQRSMTSLSGILRRKTGSSLSPLNDSVHSQIHTHHHTQSPPHLLPTSTPSRPLPLYIPPPATPEKDPKSTVVAIVSPMSSLKPASRSPTRSIRSVSEYSQSSDINEVPH